MQTYTETGSAMVVQCCVCQKIRLNGTWLDRELPCSPEDVSHGYCPECAAEAFAEIRRYLAISKSPSASVA